MLNSVLLKFPKALLLVFLISLPIAARAQFTYVTNGNAICITDYTGTNGDVTIPVAINGLPVTSLGVEAFKDCRYLTRLTILSNITDIQGGAFAFCDNLTNVTIGGGVTNIDDYAFYLCWSLSEIDFLGDAPTVGMYTFGSAGNYNANLGGYNGIVVFQPGTQGWDFWFADLLTWSSYNVTNNGAITITAYAGIGEYVYIPSTLYGLPVTGIGPQAFFNYTNLINVTFPASVTNIGAEAFGNCSNLSLVYFQSNAPAMVGPNIFDHDLNAQIFYLPGTSGWTPRFGGIPAWALYPFTYSTNNGQLAITGYTGPGGEITIPDSFTGLPITSIAAYAFVNNRSLTKVTVPDSVTNIGEDAFGVCANVTNFTLGKNIGRIEMNAFNYCTNLGSITIPSSVTNIGDAAFSECSNLTKIFFMGSAPATGTSVFYRSPTIAYYLPGMTGWSSFVECPAAPWFLPKPLILTNRPSFGLSSNQFGFLISWATNASVTVEACANPASLNWVGVATNTLTNGVWSFVDSQTTNYPSRFYRIRSH